MHQPVIVLICSAESLVTFINSKHVIVEDPLVSGWTLDRYIEGDDISRYAICFGSTDLSIRLNDI